MTDVEKKSGLQFSEIIGYLHFVSRLACRIFARKIHSREVASDARLEMLNMWVSGASKYYQFPGCVKL